MSEDYKPATVTEVRQPATVTEVRQRILDRLRNEWGVEEIESLTRSYVALGQAAPLTKSKRK